MKNNTPIYRAKKIDSEEYVLGWLLQDEQGYGVVRLHDTGEQVHIGFRWVDDEQVCYIPSSKDNLHVKE